MEVSLLSGKSTTLAVHPDASLDDLRAQVREALKVGRGRLLSPSGRTLAGAGTLREAGLKTGDVLSWHRTQVQLAEVRSTERRAFALILGDGSVVTCGTPWLGGDSQAVQEQLHNVKQIKATDGAFAALRGDGSVITWGLPKHGGSSTDVQAQLKDVQELQATNFGAFAARRSDGSVVTWGDPGSGGDCSSVAEQLHNVQQLQATEQAFAALLSDGSVLTWGRA